MKRLVALLTLTGCGLVTGDEYRVADAVPDASDDGAAEAAPRLDGGHPEASLDGGMEASIEASMEASLDAAVDVNDAGADGDAAPDVVDACTPPVDYACGSATAHPFRDYCVHTQAGMSLGAVPNACQTCGEYTCACVLSMPPCGSFNHCDDTGGRIDYYCN